MTGILEGVKIIDFTQGHLGSYGTMLLADFGAEVIKIEDPERGDMMRDTHAAALYGFPAHGSVALVY